MSAAPGLAELAAALRGARRVLVITGAGMSADSGLPTYRGVGGLYDAGPTAEGVPIEEMLSGEMLRSRPELCWKYIHEIESATRGRQPNAGHHALAAMARGFQRFTVLTQNVDGFHRRAGSRDLIEIHGNLKVLHCTDCPYEREVHDYSGLSIPPLCPWCAGLVRPRVVLFGEALPQREVMRLYQAMAEGVDAVLSIGTTSVFPYIAEPVLTAADKGLITAEINPGESEVSDVVGFRIRERAAAALAALGDLLEAGRGGLGQLAPQAAG
ncbi:MAG: NAD-dependent protein deacylase [Nevskia sp.]|nr:NAD-dependent protein deacylase [Nevskia sp.]